MREDIFNTNNLRKNKDKDLLNKVKKSKVTTNNFLRYNIVTVSSIDDLYLLNLNKEKVCVSREKDGIFMYRIKDNTLYYIPIDLISEFNKCSYRCSYCQRFGDYTYCELKLWHKEKEHIFSCIHAKLIPYHTIFIIDKSDSMGTNDITPSDKKLYNNQNFNNRLGCVIQVMNNYIKKRLDINKDDVF